jgi:hypothetical protein
MGVIGSRVAKILGLGVVLAFAAATTAVAAQSPITIALEPTVVTIATGDNSSAVVLSGSVQGSANEEVRLEARECGSSAFYPFRRVHTDRGGSFHERIAPLIRTTYRARAGGVVSGTVTAQTRPAIRFTQVSANRFNVWTIAMRFFRGAKGRMERFNRSAGRWVLVRRATLQRGSAPQGANWAYSEVTFRARVPKGTLVRFVLPRNQVGSCYLAGYSIQFNTTK